MRIYQKIASKFTGLICCELFQTRKIQQFTENSVKLVSIGHLVH